MKWKRLGHIFDPTKYRWDRDFIGYAQSPQALVFDGFVRIFFATRLRDNVGKFVSHIRYVDFTRDLREVIGWSKHEVLGPGKIGCFDEHGVFPLNVVPVGDKVYGYTNGWSRRVSVSVETGIGLVISHNQGQTFERQGDGPVLSATLHEPMMVGDPFVRLLNGTFHMWYIFGSGWKVYEPGGAPERIYKISYATSSDGIQWDKSGKRLMSDRLGPDECQALPTVTFVRDLYHMFFCYRPAFNFRKGLGYRLGYAYSEDSVSWTRDDDLAGLDLSREGWDSQMMCYPHVFVLDGRMCLLYNGNEFGRLGFGLAQLELD